MTTCDDLQTAVLRDLMRDVHHLAATYDAAMADHLYQQVMIATTDPLRRAREARALRAQAAHDFDAFIAALARLGQEHRNRLIL